MCCIIGSSFCGNECFDVLKSFHFNCILSPIDFILCCDKDNRKLWPSLQGIDFYYPS